jgi:hypothetical protein
MSQKQITWGLLNKRLRQVLICIFDFLEFKHDHQLKIVSIAIKTVWKNITGHICQLPHFKHEAFKEVHCPR